MFKLAVVTAAIATVNALPSAVPAVAKMRKLNDGLSMPSVNLGTVSHDPPCAAAPSVMRPSLLRTQLFHAGPSSVQLFRARR